MGKLAELRSVHLFKLVFAHCFRLYVVDAG